MSKHNPIDRADEQLYYARRRMKPPSRRQLLLSATDEDDLLRAPNGQVWVSLQCGDRSWDFVPLRSSFYRNFVLHKFFWARDEFPSPADWSHALSCWEAAAKDVRFHPALRVSADRHEICWDHSGGAYPTSGCFRIRPGQWTNFDHGPAPFYRPATSAFIPNLKLGPQPVFHSLLPLQRLIHAASPADWHRIVVWLLSALRPQGPCPILVLQGPAGSGKSTAARLLRDLIDPAVSPFLPLPSSEPQLHRQAFDNYILAFDHVTAMPRRLCDMLCRLSTGATGYIGGYAQELKRPIILTVPDSANWTPTPDLARRLLVVNLSEIPKSEQRPDSEIEESYRRQAQHPAVRILCDATAAALQCEKEAAHELDREAWSKAAAPILNITANEMEQALKPTRRASPLVPAVKTFLESQPDRTWEGTATHLLEELPPEIQPPNPKALGRRLTAAAADLAAEGIKLDRDAQRVKRRLKLMSSCHTPPNEQLAGGTLVCPGAVCPAAWPKSDAKENPDPPELPPIPTRPKQPDPPPPEPPPPEPDPEWDNLPPGQTMPSITVKARQPGVQETTQFLQNIAKTLSTMLPREEEALARARLHEQIRRKQSENPPAPEDCLNIEWTQEIEEEDTPDAPNS